MLGLRPGRRPGQGMTSLPPAQRPLTTDLFGTYCPRVKGKQIKPAVLPTPVQPTDQALAAFALRAAPQPAPVPSRHPYGVDALPKVTDAARVHANDVARQTAASGGELTESGRAALRAWSGEGGLGGSINAFYTPTALTEVVWEVASALGPITQTLEFSCGGGIFLSRAPKDTLLTAVELDDTSAQVAAALHPWVATHALSFEAFHQRHEGLFDLVIGNPPFGVRGATARLDRPRITQAHWYFILAGLERLQPGGLMAVIVPESMLRNPSEQGLREQVLDSAHLLTASPIPEEAFKATGAGVTTALLVLRRHDAGVREALGALTPEEQTVIREARLKQDPALRAFVEGQVCFRACPDGSWELATTFVPLGLCKYQKAVVRTGRFGEPSYGGPVQFSRVEDLIKTAKARRLDLLTRSAVEAAVRTLLGVEAEHRVRATPIQAHPLAEGQLSACGTYRFQRGQWGYHSALNHPATLSALQVAQSLTAARSAVQRRRTNAASARERTLALHQAHLDTYGPYDLTTLGRATSAAPVLGVLLAAKGEVAAALADLPDPTPAITPGTLTEVAQQLEAYGLLDEVHLSQHAGVSPSVAAAHLRAEYAFTGHTWEANTTYYRGRAHQKARQAEELADTVTGLRQDALFAQATRLRQTAPWVDLADMTLEPRDALIPEAVLTEWVNAYLGTFIAVKRNAWDTAGEPTHLIYASRDEHGLFLRMRNALNDDLSRAERQAISPARVRLLEAYLNCRTPVDAVVNQDLKTTEQIAAERNAHQGKAIRLEQALASHFRSWLLASEHAGAVETRLNEERYGLLIPAPDMRTLTLPEYQGPLAHPFQAGHVRTAARLQGVILDFAVGLGKTLTGLMLAAMLRQSGRARLPAIVVPLSRLGDWVMNAASALPDLRIRVIGGEPVRGPDGQILLDADGEPQLREDSGDQRRRKIASLLTDAPDLVVMSFEAFEMMPMLEETRMRFVQSDSTLMAGVGRSATFDERHRKMGGHRQLAQVERFTGRHLARVRVATETDVPFEATGIDAILIDEVQAMKSTYAAPAVYGESAPKFLGGGNESNRALDTNHKCRFVRANGGCTIGLSATWFTNSPLEIFNMLSLVTDALPEYGIHNVSAFTARFCVIEPRLITEPDGSVGYRSCVVGFRNLDELRAIIGQHVIRETEFTCQMHDRVGMPLPPLTTVEHLFDLAPAVQERYDAEQALVEEADSEGENHLFAIFARLSKLTLHPPLLEMDAPNARFAACVQACVAARQAGGRNVVFMYMGGEDGLTYRALKGMLVAAGYPAHEIEIITASTHPSSGERLNVERRFRRGELTCVLGSSVIEQGGNYQGGTDIHHLDYPHHHMAFVQRVGRCRRQGTRVGEIRNHLYFARGSFDVLRYQNMLGKKGWADQVFDPSITTCENAAVGFDGEEIAVMLSRNPVATRAAIRAKKEARAQEGRQASLRADLTVVQEYLDMLALLAQRDAVARGREKGPSMQDMAGINRLVTGLRGRHAQVNTLRAAGHPLAALTRLNAPVAWVEGLPLHVGMTSTVSGTAYEVTGLSGVEAGVPVKGIASGQAEVLDSARLEQATDVLPTADQAQYGRERFSLLSPALQERLEQVDVPAAVPANLILTPAPMESGLPALRLRYGLSVTASAPSRPGVEVYSLVEGRLRLGEVVGAPQFLVEWRGVRDVRQVTVVLPDEGKREQTRRLLRAQDPKLRARVDTLLQAI
jgi:predicted RNA methylase